MLYFCCVSLLLLLLAFAFSLCFFYVFFISFRFFFASNFLCILFVHVQRAFKHAREKEQKKAKKSFDGWKIQPNERERKKK